MNEILDAPHSTVNDKIIDDLQYDITSIKDKLPNVQFMEGEIENMKKEFAAMKNELMNMGNKSNKSIKRESISNGVNNLASFRRNSAQKPRVSGVKNEDNKENMSREENVVVQMDVNVNGGLG